MANIKLVANELIISRICINLFTLKYSHVFKIILFKIFTSVVRENCYRTSHTFFYIAIMFRENIFSEIMLVNLVSLKIK